MNQQQLRDRSIDRSVVCGVDNQLGSMPGADDRGASLRENPFHHGPTDQSRSTHHEHDVALQSEVHAARP